MKNPFVKVKPVDISSRGDNYEDRDRKTKLMTDSVRSIGLKGPKAQTGCKIISFKNCAIHFYYQGETWSITLEDGTVETYNAFFVMRRNKDDFVRVFWTIKDFLALVNCSISLKRFLELSCLVDRDRCLMQNKDKLIEDFIDDVYKKGKSFDFAL